MAPRKTEPRKARRIRIGSYTVAPMPKPPDDSGRLLWRLEWYPDGQGGAQRTRGLGRATLEEVERIAMQAILDVKAAGAEGPRRSLTPDVATWGRLLKVWLAARQKEHQVTGRPTAATLKLYRGCVAHLLWACGDRPLPTGTRAIAAQAIDMRDRLLRRPGTDDGLAPNTTALTLRVAAACWHWAIREELVQPIPWQAPPLHRPRTERYVPSHEDVLEVIDAIRTRIASANTRHRPPFDWPLVAFRVHHAAAPRIGELAALLVEDVDIVAGVVHFGRHLGASKTGARAARVDASTMDAVAAMLQARRDAGEILGPKDRLWPVSCDTVRTGWWRRWVRPPQHGWTPHSARYALADAFAEAGVDDLTTSAQLGNSASVRNQVYRKPIRSRTEAVVESRSLVEGGPRVVPLARKAHKKP